MWKTIVLGLTEYFSVTKRDAARDATRRRARKSNSRREAPDLQGRQAFKELVNGKKAKKKK